ncbi:MAG: hypothetical protein IJH77_05825 [Mogibacterium sp.]|nr:hypothetical protein [Mogibacterium sp.]
MEEKQEQKVKLFREKSLEAVESPESLNDYLKVTSPGIWMVMAAVILILIGGIIWSIFGQINTTVKIAVSATAEGTICYVPYEKMEGVIQAGSVNVDGKDWPIRVDGKATMATVTEEMNPFLRVAGGLEVGDVIVQTALEDGLAEGVYSGSVVTESLHPIALLMR